MADQNGFRKTNVSRLTRPVNSAGGHAFVLLGHADIRTTENIYTDWTGVKAARVAQHMDETLTNGHQMGVIQ